MNEVVHCPLKIVYVYCFFVQCHCQLGMCSFRFVFFKHVKTRFKQTVIRVVSCGWLSELPFAGFNMQSWLLKKGWQGGIVPEKIGKGK